MLRVDLRPGEGLDIDNGRIVIRVEEKSGQVSRVTVDAAREISIQVLDSSKPASAAVKGLTRV